MSKKDASQKPDNWDEEKPKVEAALAKIDPAEVQSHRDNGEIPIYDQQGQVRQIIDTATNTLRDVD